jgi:hypothetical protein
MIFDSLEVTKWLPIIISLVAMFISIISLLWNIRAELQKKRARLEIRPKVSSYHGSDDDRTKMHLIFRNLSHRSTAVTEIYVRETSNGIIKNVGEDDGVFMPIKIDPWGVQIVSFRIEHEDEKRMKDILVRDIEDNEISVVRDPNKSWHK